MQRKYKLLLIITMSSILTYFIFFLNTNNTINIMAIGDGVSSGETIYNVDGISFNNYLEDYYQDIKVLNNYNNSFSYKNYELEDLLTDIENNKEYIKQVIHKANIITIAIGEEELIKSSIIKELDIDYINTFISKYNYLLKNIEELTNAQVIVIGFYENEYLSKSNIIILNSELANIVSKYNYSFINIGDLLIDDNYFLSKDRKYFNYRGHKIISEMIINTL